MTGFPFFTLHSSLPFWSGNDELLSQSQAVLTDFLERVYFAFKEIEHLVYHRDSLVCTFSKFRVVMTFSAVPCCLLIRHTFTDPSYRQDDRDRQLRMVLNSEP